MGLVILCIIFMLTFSQRELEISGVVFVCVRGFCFCATVLY